MLVSHIVAVSKNNIIGIKNGLPWKMPHDTAYFHRITKGHCVIMGRKNFEANKGALSNRTNIVISRNPDFHLKDALRVQSIEEAIKVARSLNEKEAFIVGGGEIYRLTLNIVDRIYITIIDTIVDGDTSYPALDFSEWQVSSEIKMKKDGDNPHDFTYYVLDRPKK